MKRTRSQTGQWGEAIAAKHLESNGYSVLQRNWRHGHGELDIVAQKDELIVFVEVRTRRNDAFGMAEESISPKKRAKLIETAQAFLDAHDLSEAQWQIDVIVIELGEKNTVKRLEQIEAAIEG
jgi:putative endonuclease